MRHAVKGRKLATDSSHQKAMLSILASQIIKLDKVKTTQTRAKEVRSVVDGLITLGKKGDLTSRRRAIAITNDKIVVQKLFGELAERYKERNGGYTRLLKLGFRKGDRAPVVQIELV
jgi:large subunit ribosomal protein L17